MSTAGNESITRIERTKKGDELVSVTEISEPAKAPPKTLAWGMTTKEVIELAFKIVGLATIVIAWLDYSGRLDAKKKEEIILQKKLYQDSLQSVRASAAAFAKKIQDSVQLLKENNRSDSLLTIKQLEFYYAQEKDKKERDQRTELFQQQWLNNIQEMEKQRKDQREREYETTQLREYLEVSKVLSLVISDLNNEFIEPANHFRLNEIILKSSLISKSDLSEKLVAFRRKYDTVIMHLELLSPLIIIEERSGDVFRNACERRRFMVNDHSQQDSFDLGKLSVNWYELKKALSHYKEKLNRLPHLLQDTGIAQTSQKLENGKNIYESLVNAFSAGSDARNMVLKMRHEKGNDAIVNEMNALWKQDCELTEQQLNNQLLRLQRLKSLFRSYRIQLINNMQAEANGIQALMRSSNFIINAP